MLAAGVVHRTGSSPPAYSGVVWLFDLDFTASTWDFLPLPTGAGGASFGAWVSMRARRGPRIWSAAAVVGRPRPRRSRWSGWTTCRCRWFGLEFADGPVGLPHRTLALVGVVPYSSGWVRTASASEPPQPAIWAGDILSVLSSADPSSPVGRGRGHRHPPRAAPTWRARASAGDPASPSRRLSVPALWSNGDRTDLGTLSAPGAGPAISGPLFGWWRLPGTPATSPPDWPYPGGTGEVLGSLPVSAAGSGVARAVVAVPPCPREVSRARYFTQTVFTLTKARMPSSPSSRP